MIGNAKQQFFLPEDVVYLNGAYWSPQLKSVEEAGIKALRRKNKPYEVSADDFFNDREKLRSLFARLIHAPDPDRIAIIPSVSYGIANAVKNINTQPGQEIVLIEEQFPSNYYSWKRMAGERDLKLRLIKPPDNFNERAVHWNKNLLDAINEKTAVVAIPHFHWADGTRFDLEAVRERCDMYNALMIIDGTQSIGAYPFSVTEYRPDALICGGYKWLLGPYSLGVAYYGPYFDGGVPIEENWINRLNSWDFTNLTTYKEEFEPMAARYSVGESSNFILVPMLIKAIEQLLEWGPENIQEYCQSLVEGPVQQIREKGHWVELAEWRAAHLFGIYLHAPEKMDLIKKALLQNRIFVSYRGKAIRISPNVYNTPRDLQKLLSHL